MAPENSVGVLRHIQEHPQYYLSGGDVYLLAGSQMFRVHRYFLTRESREFEAQIESPSVPGGLHNGASKSAAIRLDGVDPAAFEKLLNVFYNPTYSVYDNWSIDDWTTIIQLAQKWGFNQVRDLAIRELDKKKMDLIDRIVLYQGFKLKRRHLIPLYGQLCSRSQALNNTESESIGLTATVLIFNAREKLRARPSDGGMSPLPDGLKDAEVHATLGALLGGGA